MPPRYFAETHEAIVVAFKRSRKKSASAIARRFKVSVGCVLEACRRAGVTTRRCKMWSTAHGRRVVEMYRGGMDTREIREAFMSENGEAPSHSWLSKQARLAGVTRSKSARQAKAAARRHGWSADEIRPEVLELVVARNWAVTQAAKHLGVGIRAVLRCLPEDWQRPDRRTSQVIRYWKADTPLAQGRLDRQAEVVYRKTELGQTYRQIHDAMGLSHSLIYLDLQRAGMVKPRKVSKIARRRLAA